LFPKLLWITVHHFLHSSQIIKSIWATYMWPKSCSSLHLTIQLQGCIPTRQGKKLKESWYQKRFSQHKDSLCDAGKLLQIKQTSCLTFAHTMTRLHESSAAAVLLSESNSCRILKQKKQKPKMNYWRNGKPWSYLPKHKVWSRFLLCLGRQAPVQQHAADWPPDGYGKLVPDFSTFQGLVSRALASHQRQEPHWCRWRPQL